MNKINVTNNDVILWCQGILRDMARSNWRPDYVVGITRGGLIPATMMSHYLNLPMHTLRVSLREHSNDQESNGWMAEDAIGYDQDEKKKILIIDDINDTGATIEFIKSDWTYGCLPHDPSWQDVWHQNVRFATLINNQYSSQTVDYHGLTVYKDPHSWYIFPWEDWWDK